jgi:hypothetical protein
LDAQVAFADVLDSRHFPAGSGFGFCKDAEGPGITDDAPGGGDTYVDARSGFFARSHLDCIASVGHLA